MLAESEKCVEGTVLCKNGKPISIEKPKQLISIGKWINDNDEADLDEDHLSTKDKRSIIEYSKGGRALLLDDQQDFTYVAAKNKSADKIDE